MFDVRGITGLDGFAAESLSMHGDFRIGTATLPDDMLLVAGLETRLQQRHGGVDFLCERGSQPHPDTSLVMTKRSLVRETNRKSRLRRTQQLVEVPTQ